MNIIIRFVLRNIAEKKLRTLLIISAIMISTALFFASTAISGTIERMFLEQMQTRVGESDLVVMAGENQASPFFRETLLHDYQDRMNYMIGTIDTGGLYRVSHAQQDPWSLRGIEMDDLQTMTPVSFYQEANLHPFQGRKIIIGRATAKEYGLQAGETIELEISGTARQFRIAAVAHDTGPFRDVGQNPFAVVPKETLSSFFDARGRVHTLYLSLDNSEQIHEVMSEIEADHPRYRVREALPQAEVAAMIGSIATPFLFLTMVVMAVSAFIIYTSFKLIAKERMPVIGTFRSIGATRKMTGWVMLSESLVYGLLGGALGSILGMGILYLMSMVLQPSWAGELQATVSFTPMQMVISFVLAVILSFGSSILPIRKAAGIPLKELILDTGEQTVETKKSRKFIYALLMVIGTLVLPRALPYEMALFSSGAAMLFSIGALILLVPYLTAGFVRFFEKIYGYIFGNEGIMAVKNLRQNGSILNSISLLALGIASLLIVNMVSFSVVEEVSNTFTRNIGYHVNIRGNQIDNRILNQAAAVEGVTEVYANYYHYGVNLVDRDGWINFHVPTGPRFFEHMTNLGISGDEEELLADLNAGRNIVVTTIFRDTHGLEIGDTLTMEMSSGSREYTVIGFIETLMENGNFALIGSRYHKFDMRPQYYSALSMMVSGTQDEVKERLEERFRNYPNLEIHTMEEWEERNHAANAQLFDILQGFSILTLIIGIFGVLNNLVISFIERKRALAVLRSIGMSKKQIVKMIFVESLTGGIIGGCIGVLGALHMLSVMPYMLRAIAAPIPITYSPTLLLIALLSGVVIMVIASVSPALKSSRLNIVESLKYE
ncbi:FtsX-like permease family protein [Dethiobacter alkaliphilus]|uniref:FtsX-like permease family protein n=1 Tax=Dethiobacter alkaliphilus TaxID=427926 RepID=UPI002227D0C6|nr:FtsX-like permease family protein [Dethiobacter alkaliphilus]MCW3488509.1 ABC transporter permease [Dethiobacter alkaliphilus]